MKNSSKLAMASAVILLLAAMVFVLCACQARNPSYEDIASSCVRIHIRANSNDENDQSVKLKVRDNVTAYLSERLQGCKTKSDAVRTLEQEQTALVKIADNTLNQYGYSYKASIALKSEYFPDRNYDGYDFPEGVYDALIIYLGNGTGDNWWCVAFPPLCFIPDSGNGDKIVYKSWVKEKLEEIFGK